MAALVSGRQRVESRDTRVSRLSVEGFDSTYSRKKTAFRVAFTWFCLFAHRMYFSSSFAVEALCDSHVNRPSSKILDDSIPKYWPGETYFFEYHGWLFYLVAETLGPASWLLCSEKTRRGLAANTQLQQTIQSPVEGAHAAVFIPIFTLSSVIFRLLGISSYLES